MKQMLVTNSSIASSSLDMNLKPITSVADPVQPQDAAARFYVDTQVQKIESELQSFFTGLPVNSKEPLFPKLHTSEPGPTLSP